VNLANVQRLLPKLLGLPQEQLRLSRRSRYGYALADAQPHGASRTFLEPGRDDRPDWGTACLSERDDEFPRVTLCRGIAVLVKHRRRILDAGDGEKPPKFSERRLQRAARDPRIVRGRKQSNVSTGDCHDGEEIAV
jgi:hypothetical protein